MKKAGAINIQRNSPDRMIECQWAKMACQVYTHNELISHQLFVIQFLQSVFLERGKYSQQEDNLPLEKDGKTLLNLLLSKKNNQQPIVLLFISDFKLNHVLIFYG